MGARYAAANDLSSVIGTEPRPSQFLPFIPYNFVYGAMKLGGKQWHCGNFDALFYVRLSFHVSSSGCCLRA